ncbi:MAG TPA: hypothetical protein VG777_05635, partial [Thermoanaerobaculia bacterium]|nr:hypothetical protein [Thermoanaerobaculia bacterium]
AWSVPATPLTSPSTTYWSKNEETHESARTTFRAPWTKKPSTTRASKSQRKRPPPLPIPSTKTAS